MWHSHDAPRQAFLLAIKLANLDRGADRTVQGVNPRWIKDMVESGIEDLDLDDLIGAKVQGVDGAYVRAMRQAGLKDADLDDLIGLKVQGVDAEFARQYLEEEPGADADDIISSFHRGSRHRHRKS